MGETRSPALKGDDGETRRGGDEFCLPVTKSLCHLVIAVPQLDNEGTGETMMRRQGEGETGETERQGDGETGGQSDRETGGQDDGETGRWFLHVAIVKGGWFGED